MSTATLDIQRQSASTVAKRPLPGHVVLLTNFMPPYRVPVYAELAKRVERLTILINTPMEPNRNWDAQWEGLDVRQLKTWTIKRPWKHDTGFTDTLHVHVSLDAAKQLKALEPDLIFSAELGARSLVSMLHRNWRAKNVPLVLWALLSEHTEQGRGWLRHRLRRYLLPRADAVIVNGASGSRYVHQMKTPPERVFEVPYTAVPDVFEHVPPTRTPEQSYRLLCPGQLIERKGIVPFLEALDRWAQRHPDQRAEFDIVGSGPLTEQIAAMQHPSNLSVQLLGERPYEELVNCFAQCGILAFPTLADEWGLVVNEAMAAGMPVLGSRYAQAVDELCTEGETGWTFRPDHPKEMDRALDQALATPLSQLDQMRLACRERVAPLTPAMAADGIAAAFAYAMQQKNAAN